MDAARLHVGPSFAQGFLGGRPRLVLLDAGAEGVHEAQQQRAIARWGVLDLGVELSGDVVGVRAPGGFLHLVSSRLKGGRRAAPGRSASREAAAAGPVQSARAGINVRTAVDEMQVLVGEVAVNRATGHPPPGDEAPGGVVVQLPRVRGSTPETDYLHRDDGDHLFAEHLLAARGRGILIHAAQCRAAGTGAGTGRGSPEAGGYGR